MWIRPSVVFFLYQLGMAVRYLLQRGGRPRLPYLLQFSDQTEYFLCHAFMWI
jgi:hypothetical protein